MRGAIHKACDRCRSRKIRCKQETDSSCGPCLAHNLPCTFSYQKRRTRRRNPDGFVPTSPFSSTTDPKPLVREEAKLHSNPDLYIDFLLQQGPAHNLDRPSTSTDQQSNTLLGLSSNISFFPAGRVRAINQRLGHNRLEHLLDVIRGVIASKLKISNPSIGVGFDRYPSGDTKNGQAPTHALIRDYIKAYMELVHPLYPFLPRDDFEKRAFAPNGLQDIAKDKSWACLYYAIIAVGCQNSDGGSYEGRSGVSWAYFEKSVSAFRDVGCFKGSLTLIQALMSLAIYCQSLSGFGLEPALIAQAVVMAQNLGLNRATSSSEGPSDRTFWVLYHMEKTSCFLTGRVPILQDAYISCPLPDTSAWAFSDYDWFFSFVRYARLVSRIQSQLLSITSVTHPEATCYSTVKSLHAELGNWRSSIPVRFRPGEPIRPRQLPEPRAIAIALRTHYYYHYASLTLTWSLVHSGNNGLDTNEQLEVKTELMQTARSVLELTSFIEISPSTPVWIVALAPISALMILFDLVIHNPNHPETTLNLALLDIASGHFSRIEYSSNGTLPGRLISEFAHLARQYISDMRHVAGRQHGQAGAGNVTSSFPQSSAPRISISQPAGDALATTARSEVELPSNTPLPQGASVLSSCEEQGVSAAELANAYADMASFSAAPDPIFFPQMDGSMDSLPFFGVDLMGLFDSTYPFYDMDQMPECSGPA